MFRLTHVAAAWDGTVLRPSGTAKCRSVGQGVRVVDEKAQGHILSVVDVNIRAMSAKVRDLITGRTCSRDKG